MSGKLASQQHVHVASSRTSPVANGPAPVAIAAQLSISQITSYHWSLPETVTALQRLGIPGIGLWRPRVADFGEERTVELLTDSNVRATSVAWAGGFTGSTGLSFNEAVEDACEAIQLAAKCQASCVHIACGGRRGHTVNHARRLVIDALRRLGDFAGQRQVTLALRPMPAAYSRQWSFLTELDETLDLLNLCHHPSVKLGLGTCQLVPCSGWLERLREIGGDVASVQLNDTRQQQCREENDHCMIGTGQAPLQHIVSSLRTAGFSGHFEIDLWSETLWKQEDYTPTIQEARRRFLSFCEA
ncbi:MAG: sugar phosphate isomerase/epimerase family protein [Planctomycetaceae bacterium]